MINSLSIETTGVPLSSGNSFTVKISNYINSLPMYDLYQYNSSFVQTFIHYDVIPWADAIHVQLIDKNVQELINEKNNKSVFKLYHCCMI